MELLEEHRCFEGRQQRWRHDSTTLNCAMTFSIFLPPAENPPVLFWLSGLTCNDENFTTKAGAQRIAAELGIALVMPDTSPRGEDVADDLTTREFTMAMLACRGWTNAEIARHMGVSPGTVKNRLSGVYAKLGIGTRAELVAHMLR